MVNVSNLEVDTNGGEECILIGLVSVSKKEAGLSNGRISDEDNLEDEVVLGEGHWIGCLLNQKRNYSIPLLNIGINKNLTDFSLIKYGLKKSSQRAQNGLIVKEMIFWDRKMMEIGETGVIETF